MEYIKFANIEYFYLFLAIPALMIIVYLWGISYKASIKKYFSQTMIDKLAGSFSKRKALLKRVLQVMALLLIIFALTGPKIGTKLIEVKREGIDIVIALDLSKSMHAEDITPDRLTKAKYEIKRFIEGLEGDRIGLVGFTSGAFVQCPLTTDYSAALMFLDVMNTNLLPQNGTSLAEAIRVSSTAFDEEEGKNKLLVIISDGEDHEQSIEEAVSEATNKGVTITTIGIGSLNGVPIPQSSGFLKDKDGKTVITKLNEGVLKSIAVSGNGSYYLVTPMGVELEEIFDEIAKMEKKEFSSKKYEDYEEKYAPFLLFGFVLIVLEMVISSKKRKKKEIEL